VLVQYDSHTPEAVKFVRSDPITGLLANNDIGPKFRNGGRGRILKAPRAIDWIAANVIAFRGLINIEFRAIAASRHRNDVATFD
jgi:hypothetical protein